MTNVAIIQLIFVEIQLASFYKMGTFYQHYIVSTFREQFPAIYVFIKHFVTTLILYPI